ncbi:hypothetical protein CVIRNUC_003315 [Coccomyxa viridis]|uniref:Nucleoside 2-deoxyribosyltransferase n=1 Tax=Coccomyxa viridis TaxID=1274662 RepID=A0AAV1I1Z5_9CHLO|nr:hypothetical protein CVIRNUC_003315 [Coccomyxa viridis]
MQPRIYLAGPARKNEHKRHEDLKAQCLAVGMVAVSPNDAPTAGTIADAQMIRDRNLGLIQSCDAVLADLLAFRGPSADCGCVYECGYASALNKPVVAYHVWQDYTYRDKVHVIITRDNAAYNTLGLGQAAGFKRDRDVIEDFGLFDKLMLAAGLQSTHETQEDAILALATLFSSHDPSKDESELRFLMLRAQKHFL